MRHAWNHHNEHRPKGAKAPSRCSSPWLRNGRSRLISRYGCSDPPPDRRSSNGRRKAA